MILEENISMDFILPMLQGLQQLIGSNCEIIVHDFREGFDQTIVYEVNAALSGRQIGGKPRGAMIVNFGKDIKTLNRSQVFLYKGKNGQVYKSCSTLLSDNSNSVIGSLCINIEISNLIGLNSQMTEFLTIQSDEEPLEEATSIMAKNVDDVLQYYISTCEKQFKTSMELMTKEQKIKALAFLDEKGVFKISKANVTLCERFQVSKYTLYNYLDEARKVKGR